MPFQCILFPTPLFPRMGEPLEVPAVHYWFQASERVWDSAHVHLQRVVQRRTSFADTLRAPITIQETGYGYPTGSPRYIGPFMIQRQINEVTYQLQLPPSGIDFVAPLPLQIPTSLLQRSWTSHPYIRSETSWTRSDGVAGLNI